MLVGCVPWPTKDLLRWNASGYREGRPIVEIVRAAAAQYPDKPAVIENDSVLSYAQLLSKAEALAAALLGAGLRPLDRVVMQLPNSAEFVIAFLALSRIGAIPVMALRAHRHSEIRHFIDASGAVAYMVPGVHGNYDYRALAQDMQRECPTLRCAFVLDGALAGQHSLRDLLEKPMDEAARQALDAVWVNAAEVAVMLSGGTTSISKLIPRTHDDYVLNARLCARAAGFDENTVFLALLPLGHNYNLAAPGMLGVFYYGGTVVIGHGTQAEQVFPLVEKHGVTVIAAAVPLITGWLNSDVPSRHDLRSLRVVQNGGARLAPELRRRIHGQWGAIPQEIYGTAEGLINMTRLDDPEDLLLESSGAPVCDDDEIKVVDDDGREVPDGEPGELLTRGPYTIAGYYNAPEKNREAFTEDGFYRMGDIVRKKGRYVFANVQAAQERRFQSLKHPDWVPAMVFQITRRKVEWFRWHDSGDIQGIWHLAKICEVAAQCPDVGFWLPTRELGIVKYYLIQGGIVPDNLTIRLSAHMIDGKVPSSMLNTSTVVSDTGTASCPARFQDGKCGSCRKCWDKEVLNVSYPQH